MQQLIHEILGVHVSNFAILAGIVVILLIVLGIGFGRALENGDGGGALLALTLPLGLVVGAFLWFIVGEVNPPATAWDRSLTSQVSSTENRLLSTYGTYGNAAEVERGDSAVRRAVEKGNFSLKVIVGNATNSVSFTLTDNNDFHSFTRVLPN